MNGPRPIAVPPINGQQDAEGPGVTWHEGVPWCTYCPTQLVVTSTVDPRHQPLARPLRVPVCPVCGGKP